MKKLAIVSVIVLVLATAMSYFISTTYSPKATAVASAPLGTPTKAGLLRFTNDARISNGLPPLVEDSRLDQSAQMKADDMTKYHYVGHISPNDNQHGYSYIWLFYPECVIVSENIAGASSSKQAVDEWLSSKAHRDALLNSKNLNVGFGISGFNIVQHFCVAK